MIPWEVLTDRRLSARALRVYAVLAASSRGGKVSIGGRRLAQKACVARQRVRESIGELQKLGLIEVLRSARGGGRAKYRLTAELFSAAASTEEPEPNQDPAKNPVIVCTKCKQACRGLLKVGWCRSCNWKLKIRKVVREEIALARTA